MSLLRQPLPYLLCTTEDQYLEHNAFSGGRISLPEGVVIIIVALRRVVA